MSTIITDLVCELCERPAQKPRPDPMCKARESLWCDPCYAKLQYYARKRPVDPLKFFKRFWPDVRFYKEQIDIIYSVLYDDETVVVAANKMGKDFVAGAIVVYWFMTGGGRGFNVQTRIITTSVAGDHLDVLWGEIHQFIQTACVPLDVKQGGKLIVNQLEIRKMINGKECPKSYIKGIVAGDNMEKLAGHHCPATLFVVDEASGVSDLAYEKSQGWKKRMLMFGNPHPCTNYFRRAVKDGSIIDPGEEIAA